MKAGKKDIGKTRELDEAQIVKKSLCGEIKFRKNRKLMFLKMLFRSMTYVLVAALSGSIAGIYVANQKMADFEAANARKTTLLQENTTVSNLNKSSNDIIKIIADVGQAVVSISNNDDGSFSDNSDDNISGIIFKSNGYIVTNYSKIRGTSKHMVKLSSGRNTKPIEAKIIGHDDVTDLAVIKINKNNLPTAVFGNVSNVQVGEHVVAIGNNNGAFTSMVTAGIVSTFIRKEKVFNYNTGALAVFNIIQTDAQINNSNVGGALCNDAGEVIGINQGGEDGRNGYAVQIDEVQKIVDAIIKNGHVSRPYAGFSSEDYASGDRKQNGVLVNKIINGTGAEKSGIKVNDIIVEFDMLKIKSNDDINDIIQRHSAGDVIPCKVLRNGKSLNLKITLSEIPTDDN